MPHDLDTLKFSSKIGLNAKVINYRYRRLAEFFQGDSVLELGCADGQGLDILLQKFSRVVAVDGSKRLLNRLKRTVQSPKLTLVHSYFEKLSLNETFDTVLMGHILEHVDDPQTVIRQAIKHLKPNGILIADVPNGNSIHRHVGVAMGLLQSVTDLNDADRSIGHQRVYMPETFRSEFTHLNLDMVTSGGFFIKPLANYQLETCLDEKQLGAFLAVGEQFANIAAEIYVVCRRKD